MRKTLATASALFALSLVGPGAAVAAPPDCPPASPNAGNEQPCGNPGGGNGGGQDNVCPPASPNAGNQQPCGNPGGGNGGGNGGGQPTCPPSSPNAGNPPPCGNPGGGNGGGEPEPPAGNCERADLVLLTPDVKLVCLFLGENAQYATKEADCPDALIALPVSPVVGACVFLPPAEN